MMDVGSFGLAVSGFSGVGLAAILLNRVSERIQIPAPAFFLVGSAIAVRLVPDLGRLDQETVQRVVSIALVVILFDGGVHLGWRRFRRVAAPVALLGVVGTFLTAAGVAVFAHIALGFDWYVAVLLGAAIAPTDPAVVFAVLGNRVVGGPSGTVLAGESGANDPVGIALMSALVTAGGLSGAALMHGAGNFTVQMVVGLAGGLLGGRALLWFIRAVPLPDEGLYALRGLAGVFLIFGLTSAAGGSGFLAVFVAGIMLGDARVPYKRETERFVQALAGLGEIVAFLVLGATVDLDVLARQDVWVPGLVLAVCLAVLIRPVLVGLCMVPLRIGRRDQGFVLWAGLKGAVPILLGSMLLGADVPDAPRLYGVVVVVVMVSVVLQGSTVGLAAALLRIPMHTVAPMPYSLGVRLRKPPDGAHRVTVAAGSIADGIRVRELPRDGERQWVSLVVRDGRLMQVRRRTRLAAGDQVLVLVEQEQSAESLAVFTEPAPWRDES